MTSRQVKVAARVSMALAYVAVCAALVLVMVPPLRQWARYRAQVMDYHLSLLCWNLGSAPAPDWTKALERDDLPPEEVGREPR